MKEKYDIIIIGAGVIGCAVASKLSAYKARIAVLESAHDLACGASKANSGIVHGGFDALPGTKKAFFNVLGCALTEWESKRLDFPYRKNGSMVLAFDKEEEKTLHTLMERGIKNRVPGLSIISGEQARGLESGISEKVTAALLCTNAGVCGKRLRERRGIFLRYTRHRGDRTGQRDERAHRKRRNLHC